MKLLEIILLFLFTIMCNDLCAGLFLKPWIKSVKNSLLYGRAATNYGYRNNPYGYNNYNNYGYYGGGGGGRGGSYYRQNNGGQRTGRTYTDIARVLNANPYAFIGARPFPAQPFYPIAG